MAKQIRVAGVAASLFFYALIPGSVDAGSGLATGAKATWMIPSHPPRTAANQNVCLECHGPLKDLAERTAKHKAPSGETITPHRLIPHKGKESAPPDCKNCHQAHPVPPGEGDLAALPKPNVDWCYKKCHHTKDFTPCTACHKYPASRS